MGRPFDLITFDFDGVLLHNNFQDLMLAHCRAQGFAWPDGGAARLARFIHNYYAGEGWERDLTEHGREAVWPIANRRFLRALGVEGEDEALLAHAVTLTEEVRRSEISFFHEHGIHEILETLRVQGYRLAMLTNRDDRVHEDGAEWGLIEPFELIGTRETVGKPKPEPDLYHHIADYFGVSAERSLHIGDNPHADVLGARAAGWHSLLIDPNDLFEDWDVPRIPTLHDLVGWLEER